MTQEFDRNQCIHERPQKFFQGGKRRNCAYTFQVTDDAMQMGVHKTLYPSYPISLCWLNLNFQSFAWNVFYTSAIRNVTSFYKLRNVHCFEHFLQWCHNLKIINIQKNMRGEKPRKSDTLVKLYEAMRSRTICWQDYWTTY